MCGIVGILGQKAVAGDLVDALRRLEYRGYDSAGIATVENGHLDRRRAEGKLKNLELRLSNEPLQGHVGIGHTRWATHGKPDRAQRASAHERARLGRAQRHHRELPRAEEEAHRQGPQVRDRHRHRVVVHLITDECWRATLRCRRPGRR